MESKDKLEELQKDCLSLREEVRDWKKRSYSVAKNSKTLAELLKTTVMKPSHSPQAKDNVCSVNVQVGTSFLTKNKVETIEEKEVRVFKVPQCMSLHPAPLPKVIQKSLNQDSSKLLPPNLKLHVSNVNEGIQLFWTLTGVGNGYSEVLNYEIYAYLETSKPPSIKFWKKVGDIKAIPLPIRCTLSQFKKGSKYHFSVRARDINSHFGDYSEIKSVLL